MSSNALEHHQDMTPTLAGTTRHPENVRTSLPFRLTTAVVTGLLALLGASALDSIEAGSMAAWGMALLAGGCVFVFSDLLLPLLVVAIPPGLFILTLVGLTGL